jgi:hypothetical protein
VAKTLECIEEGKLLQVRTSAGWEEDMIRKKDILSFWIFRNKAAALRFRIIIRGSGFSD